MRKFGRGSCGWNLVLRQWSMLEMRRGEVQRNAQIMVLSCGKLSRLVTTGSSLSPDVGKRTLMVVSQPSNCKITKYIVIVSCACVYMTNVFVYHF